MYLSISPQSKCHTVINRNECKVVSNEIINSCAVNFIYAIVIGNDCINSKKTKCIILLICAIILCACFITVKQFD